jgi:hypothetical protein
MPACRDAGEDGRNGLGLVRGRRACGVVLTSSIPQALQCRAIFAWDHEENRQLQLRVFSDPDHYWQSTQSGAEYFFMSCSEAAIELFNAGKIDVSAKDSRAFKRCLYCVLS